ncbi:MAG: hypothetical protein ACI81R_003888 [Bradymonadia bacterium]|jgi:hypothetical protein
MGHLSQWLRQGETQGDIVSRRDQRCVRSEAGANDASDTRGRARPSVHHPVSLLGAVSDLLLV